MDAERIASERRRELLAKTAMDIAKIVIGAIFAGGLLINLDMPARLALALVVLAFLLVGFFICPKDGGK